MVHRSVLSFRPTSGRSACVRSRPRICGPSSPYFRFVPVWLAGYSIAPRTGTMTRRSHGGRYFRRRPALIDVGRTSRLPAVRVRTYELRLIALGLAGCWTVAAAIVLIAYRPGGPIDVAVGAAALLPAL